MLGQTSQKMQPHPPNGHKKLIEICKTKGPAEIQTTKHAEAFLRSVCSNANPSDAVSLLVTSAHGLEALKKAVSFELTPDAINARVISLLKYLSSPELAIPSREEFVSSLFAAIQSAPFLLQKCLDALKANKLSEPHLFAWFVFRLVASDQTLLEDHVIKQIKEACVQSTISTVKQYGSKMNSLAHGAKYLQADPTDVPGGRHDNDHANFRQIQIMPTAEEIVSTASPYLVRSADLQEAVYTEEADTCYLDRQFRLLREDIVGPLREEVANLRNLGDLDARTFARYSRRTYSIIRVPFVQVDSNRKGADRVFVEVPISDPPALNNSKRDQSEPGRRKFWMEQPGILSFNCVVCVLLDMEPFCFATVCVRDVDLLKLRPSRIGLRFENSEKVYDMISRYEPGRWNIVQVSASMFAYEPILKCLQKLEAVPFKQTLLEWKLEEEDQLDPSITMSKSWLFLIF